MGKYYWILAGVVIVVVIYFMGGKWTGQVGQYIGIEPSPSPSSATGATAKPVAKKSVTPLPKSYTELAKEYEGRRIQFDDRCQMIPLSPTYKNGTSVMLDNRSTSTKSVTIGSVKYDLSAYGYRVITLSSSSLPKELAISCGSSGNVGRILLQAQILQ